MPEYVYALHDFTPENPDEVPFKAGDKIEVVEKDELYQDGWWQVSFPVNFVTFGERRYFNITTLWRERCSRPL